MQTKLPLPLALDCHSSEKTTQLSWSRPCPWFGTACDAHRSEEHLQVLSALTFPLCFKFFSLFCMFSQLVQSPAYPTFRLHTEELKEGNTQAQHSAVVGLQPGPGAAQCLLHAVTRAKAETVIVASNLYSTFLGLGSVPKQILQHTEPSPQLGHWENTQVVLHSSSATGRTQEAPSFSLTSMLPILCESKQSFRSAP